MVIDLYGSGTMELASKMEPIAFYEQHVLLLVLQCVVDSMSNELTKVEWNESFSTYNV